MTDRCNFACAYCYEPKSGRTLSLATLLRTIEGLFPFFERDVVINFYGGEPLLAFDHVRKAVDRLGRLNRDGSRKFRFSLSTNGSLIDREVLEFLDEHSFAVLLSFDGTAQDAGRKLGSYGRISALIPEIRTRPRIELATNSVFTAGTIGRLASSLELLIRLGVPRIHAGISPRGEWTPAAFMRLKKEMARARALLLDRYDRPADVPWIEIAGPAPRGSRRCDAGRKQLALATDGRLWGCFLFPHFFAGRGRNGRGDAYSYGDIDAFLADPEAAQSRVLGEAARLGMMNARTPERSCVMCDEFARCWICPLAAAFSSGKLGRISVPTCEMSRLLRRERELMAGGFRAKRRAAARAATIRGVS